MLRILSALFVLAGCAAAPPRHPGHAKLPELIDRGTLFLREAKLAEAESTFRTALELGPSARALDGLGCVAMHRGDARAAEFYLLQAIEVDEGYAPAFAHLALLSEISGDAPRAERWYRAALARDPLDHRARNNFGVFLAESVGEPEAARETLRRGFAAKPAPLIERNLSRVPVLRPESFFTSK